jgi:dienelactone hydrolase
VLRYPAVLLVSGAGRQDRDGVAAGDTARGALAYRPLYDLADTLTRRGIAVLRLDDRGVGASTGSLDSATTPDRAEDARAAVDYLRRRSEIDPRRIAVLGMSEGASIAALVASTDAGIRGIVLMAGPAGTATQVSAPALVLQGDADDTVPPAGADELGAALRTLSRDVTVRHFPGLGHAFVLPEDLADGGLAVPAALKISRPVRGAIADWMTTRLGGPVEGPAPQASRRRHRHHR